MKIVSSLISDKIEIVDAGGNTLKEFPYQVNAAKVADEVAAKRREIAALTESKDENGIQKATVELFNAIFGTDTTNGLLEFYHNDYLTMMADIAPIVIENIFPVFDALREKAVALRKRAKRG